MRTHPDWLPYLGPMIGFGVVLTLGDYLPETSPLILLALRVIIPGAIFGYFVTIKAYPELVRPRAADAPLDIAVGLLATVIWVGPYLLWPGLRPDPPDGWDPSVVGADMRLVMLALRFVGFVCITPFIEELLVRDFLMRSVDAYREDKEFTDIPVGMFTWWSFGITLGWFTFTHVQWEWPVAFLTGIVYNLWIYRRKRVGSLILAHAVTNAALFFWVVLGSTEARDLWFFL